MELGLRFFAMFREAVGQESIYWRVDDDAMVGDALRSLEVEYDSPTGRLIEDGEVKPYVNVLKNGHEVAHPDGMVTALDDGDAVSIFPPIAGG